MQENTDDPKQWSLFIPFIAPLILCIVALNQFVQTRWSDLSPWKGGGFGMFSTVESPASRIVRIHLSHEGVNIPVKIPRRFSRLESALKTNPSAENVSRLANALAVGTWARYTMTPVQQEYLKLRARYFGNNPPDSLIATRQHTANLDSMAAKMDWVQWVEPGEDPQNPIPYDYVEVVCYQVEFRPVTGKLILTPITHASKKYHVE